MNALDTALVKLAAASNALERHAPTPQDVEEAKENAKSAHKLLDAAFTLMSAGIYSVAESPTEAKYNDTNDYQIALPEVREEIVAEEPQAPLPPFPGILAEFDGWSEEDQLNEFEHRLEDLRVSLPDADEQDLAQWDAAWETDRQSAFTRLLIAEAREPRTFLVPTDEEVAAWRAQFTEPETVSEPEHLVNFRSWDADEQLRQFEALLGLLEDEGVAQGMKRKQWKPFGKEWNDLFISGREHAWDRLWTAYHTLGCSCGFRIPTDEEIQAALATAPVEEIPVDVDPFEAEEGGAQ